MTRRLLLLLPLVALQAVMHLPTPHPARGAGHRTEDLWASPALVREVGANVVSVTPRHETLEDLFIRAAKGDAQPAQSEERIGLVVCRQTGNRLVAAGIQGADYHRLVAGPA